MFLDGFKIRLIQEVNAGQAHFLSRPARCIQRYFPEAAAANGMIDPALEFGWRGFGAEGARQQACRGDGGTADSDLLQGVTTG